ASSVSWHECYGTLRPRGNTKKPKSPDDMFAKTGIPDAGDDGSGDSDSKFVGSCAGWTENDRTLRKHTPRAKNKKSIKEMKQWIYLLLKRHGMIR
ncbi:MAG: hypothetical protein ACK53Y_19670, partial [bacterium]